MNILIEKNVMVPMRDGSNLRIHHDSAHLSHLILPIIERD